jgi:hypothetical protein
MTGPSPNPGGSHRELMRNALAEWITAQQIAGVAQVFPSHRHTYNDDEFPQGGSDCVALVLVVLPFDSEDRAAYTGPRDAGGKDVHYSAELHVTHRGFHPDDWPAIENDYDRIIDALKDSLRGNGRDLGRPLAVFQVGELPREGNITHTAVDPVEDEDAGTVTRQGVIAFTITQYLQPST